MTGLNHVLTGSAIGLALQQPLLVVPVAFLSHFVLDAIPHFDHEVYRWGHKYFAPIMIIDGLISLGSIIFLMIFFPHASLAIALGAFFAILPDFFWLYYYIKGRPQLWFFRFHSKIQWYEQPPGAIVEASYLILISTIIVAIGLPA